MSVQRVRLEIDSSVRRVDNGTALLGGAPFRLIRLSEAGARMLDGWLRGEPVGESPAAQRLAERLVAAGMIHPTFEPERRTESACADGVGFVVPVYDDAAGLEQLLRAVRAEYPAEPIVVVDDASAIERQAIEHLVAKCRAVLIRHDRNRGPGAARNTGWRHLLEQHDPDPSLVVVFLDADVVPSPGALGMLLGHFARDEGADAATSPAVVAPRVRALPGLDTIARYEADNSPLDMGDAPAIVRPGTRLSYVPSAAFVVDASVLESSGGFDESMRFGEDVDLVWRLVEQGHLVRYEPRSVVHHRNRGSLRALARQRFDYGSSAAALGQRHGDTVAPLQLPASVVASTLAVFFGGTRLRLAAGAAAAVSVRRLARRIDASLEAPVPEAVRLVGLMHGYALQAFAAAATRTWAPLLLPSRRARRALIAALVVPAVADWLQTRPPLDPVSHVVMRAVDHGAYCAGVWRGALRTRSIAALLPSVRFGESVHD